MKKIVFVSSLQIFPPMSGGQLRSAHLTRALARLGYEVEIYSFTGRKEDYLKRKPTFSQKIETNITETVNMNPVWGLLQFLAYRWNLPPFWITGLLKIYRPRFLRKLLKTADEVLIDFPFLHTLLASTQDRFWVNTHNVEYDLWKDRPLVAALVKKIELASFAKAAHVIFCSEDDRQKFLSEVPGLEVKSSVVANGVDLTLFSKAKSLRDETRHRLGLSAEQTVFLFTGSTYQPNQEAFQFLKSYAQVHQQQLRARKAVIIVAGTVCEELHNEEHFKILGKVEEMIPYFAAADFGLNPIVQGSGVNVKMTEYIAAELPILSTGFGCRGLNLRDGHSALIFERENLQSAIDRALDLTGPERQALARTAMMDNEKRVDMSRALEHLFQNTNESGRTEK